MKRGTVRVRDGDMMELQSANERRRKEKRRGGGGKGMEAGEIAVDWQGCRNEIKGVMAPSERESPLRAAPARSLTM